MSQSGTPLAVELKTVSGRKCTVDPPFTAQRLVDAAVDQLHLERSTIKLFVERRLVYMWKPEDSEPNQRLRAQVTVPKGGSVLVVGKPTLRQKTHPSRAKGVDASKGSPAADGSAEKKKSLSPPWPPLRMTACTSDAAQATEDCTDSLSRWCSCLVDVACTISFWLRRASTVIFPSPSKTTP
ncbi:hypothetical protein TCDM_01167 [Trypanosoma cruzi Dm28c]|uniref:Ubiquitin-like domain-containing protein n=1 Tax=Trypanosoma cruzi Dm28c TaxID=1416333 RepID=V5BZW9_TRYCR|nr:hypothetical protein TCDM_01167 [Trypanosoma cruzi Dm28c]